MTVLVTVGIYAVVIVALIGLTRIGVEYERRKRAQFDLDALLRSVHDPRGRHD
jgi:hypothetical protein